ncbi:MAG: hypothetical protein ACLFP8_03760 [Alphaproteobacteria bacterium]
MASFDFIEAAARGYEFTWRERRALLRAGMPVVVIHIVCIMMVYALQVHERYLLSGLILMPAYVFEALYVVSVVRFMVFGERLFDFFNMGKGEYAEEEAENVPQQANKNTAFPQEKVSQSLSSHSSVQSFKAAFVIYMLLKVLDEGARGAIQDYDRIWGGEESLFVLDQSPLAAIFILLATGAALWLFRIMWLYIPVALGFSIRGFLRCAKGMMSSLSMFATWFVCYFPLLIAIVVCLMVVSFFVPTESAVQVIVFDVVRVTGSLLLMVVQVAAMTFGYLEMLAQRSRK